MKLKDIIKFIKADTYVIKYCNLTEEIRATEAGSFRALRKYDEWEVVEITPINNAIEITLK